MAGRWGKVKKRGHGQKRRAADGVALCDMAVNRGVFRFRVKP